MKDQPLVRGFIALLIGGVIGFLGSFFLLPLLGVTGWWYFGSVCGLTFVCAVIFAVIELRS